MRFKQFNENSALEKAALQVKKNFSDERKVVQDEVNKLVRMVQMGKGDKLELARALTALTKTELQAKAEDPDLKYSVDLNIGMMKRAMDMLKGEVKANEGSTPYDDDEEMNAEEEQFVDMVVDYYAGTDEEGNINYSGEHMRNYDSEEMELAYSIAGGDPSDTVGRSNFLHREITQRLGLSESVEESLTEEQFDEKAVANESIDVFDFFYNDTDSIEDIKNYNWDSVSDKEIEDLENFAYTMYRGSRDDDSLGEYFSTASNFLDNLLAQRKGNVSESLESLTEAEFDEAAGEKDACYRKVKSRYKVWPSAYASGALVKCRKVGAANWGNSKKK